jgi:Protein of unknown function (DUF429)
MAACQYEMTEAAVEIRGVDFTSRPNMRKTITVARGHLQDAQFFLTGVDGLDSFERFEALLVEAGPWVAAFDFPFGLPREFCAEIGWLKSITTAKTNWSSITKKLATISREDLTNHCRAYCDARPVGSKFAHRPVDRLAGSSPSMKWVNPPVVYMLKEGAPRLLAAGVHIPGQHGGDETRIALEAYPGFLARSITKASYKNDQRGKQTPALFAARKQIVDTLLTGEYSLAIKLSATKALQKLLIEDGSGDTLDAVLCALQAAWAWQRREQNFGLPSNIDPLEGWIVTV